MIAIQSAWLDFCFLEGIVKIFRKRQVNRGLPCNRSQWMLVTSQAINRPGGHGWLITAEEKLDRALVAGLMLEVALEAPGLPTDPQIRRRHIKNQLTCSMVRHLAGRITLDRFRTLMQRLEHWFPFYYPLMPSPPQPQERPEYPGKTGGPATARSQPLIRRDLLKEWLAEGAAKMLPRRPQRKFKPERLEDFFHLAQACWFRVKDLAQYFAIDRKTAWEYLQKLQEAGLLVHNGERSAAVRYRLADRFLKINLAALEQQVALALTGSPKPTAARVAQDLAATDGSPFWEDRWLSQMPAGRRGEISTSLKTAGVLEVVYQSGRRRMLRLRPHWLKE